MEAILKIKCSNCGAILAVKDAPDIKSRSITCPVCKIAANFVDYKPYTAEPKAASEDPKTRIAGNTDYSSKKNRSIGKLLHVGSGTLYQLELGINTIGRKTISSTSSVKIDTDDKTMSRQHAIIEVVELASGGYKHYFTNANNKNATLINNHKVENGDKLILNGGEEIKMAEVIIKFILSKEAKKQESDSQDVKDKEEFKIVTEKEKSQDSQ